MSELAGEGLKIAETAPSHIPDLMVEYAEEQYTFCGKTGTLPELIKDCPFDKSKMTLESKNKFAVGIMNESGSTIKEEHMPYFQEVVESHNQELKVKVREEPNAALIAEKVDSSIDHAQIDEPAAAALRAYSLDRVEHTSIMFERAKQRGEIRGEVDSLAATEMLSAFAWKLLLTGRLQNAHDEIRSLAEIMTRGMLK